MDTLARERNINFSKLLQNAIRKRMRHQHLNTHYSLKTKRAAAHAACAFFNGSSFYSAGMMNERELKIFFVTFGVSVGKPTSTPMTLSPLFAMRTET